MKRFLEESKLLLIFYRRIYGRYAFKSALLVFFGFTNGILGSIGILSLIPFLTIVNGNSLDQDNPVMRFMAGIFEFFDFVPSAYNLLGIIVCIFILKAIVAFAFTYMSGYLNIKISNGLKEDFFSRSLTSKWSFLSGQKIGYMEHALLNDLPVTSTFLNRMYDTLNNIMTFTAYAVTAFFVSPSATSAMLVLGMVFLALYKLVTLKIRSYTNSANLNKRSTLHFINENVLGMKTLKAMGRELAAISSLKALLKKSEALSLKLLTIGSAIKSPTEPMSVIFVAVLFMFTRNDPGFSLASFGVIVYLVHRLFIYIDKFQDTIYVINSSIPSIKRIMELSGDLDRNHETDIGTSSLQFNDSIEFKNMSFSYGSKTIGLNNINIKIKKGNTVGIIGPSGAGKTTLVDLLLRLLSPTGGVILADGKDIKDISIVEWRKSIAYMPQDLFLFDGSIGDNIKFFDDSVTVEDIIKASQDANIYEFIKKLPKGFDTSVGDRGMALSVGQRQRIVLARALARKPKILVLDEVTSSLDGESEALIKESIKGLKGKVTVIIVAHRLSTIAGVDHIVAIKDGAVVEEGSPEELLKETNSYFYKMHASAK